MHSLSALSKETPTPGHAGSDAPVRDNADWLLALRTEGAVQARALEALGDYLRRALTSRLGREGAAPTELIEDVVQDALLRVLDQLDAFEGRSRFTTWAATIAVRLALTELRRKRWKDVSLDTLLSEGASADAAVEPPEAEARLHQTRLVRALEELVESALSERQRVAILAELGGMPQAEIGEQLGVTRNAVYKLTFDARKKLKHGLEAAGFDASAIRAAFS
ncbi:MAG: sigma-70 family RNA polymerase sigma factor [Myxococcota bacterium]